MSCEKMQISYSKFPHSATMVQFRLQKDCVEFYSQINSRNILKHIITDFYKVQATSFDLNQDQIRPFPLQFLV